MPSVKPAPKSPNPFDSLIEAANDDPEQIHGFQAAYEGHRLALNAEHRVIFSSSHFGGVSVDPILLRLVDPTVEPGFVDPRHSITFIARPPDQVLELIRTCQDMVRQVVPGLWLYPRSTLHMTALEMTHSRTADEIALLVNQLRDVAPSIVNHPVGHRTRLIKPFLCFNTIAVALTFIPAVEVSAPGHINPYTYHHMRRDLFDHARTSGAEIGSRYAVPSAHITIGRYIRTEDFETDGKVDLKKANRLVERIDEINALLERELWPKEDGSIAAGGEWIFGEQKGLEWHTGPVWYGSGGETLLVGEGFLA
ncbi:RNA ligase/cyclic nucleotide phosphodiesterase [Mycena maculata]|uniref:RNA ligase/cyclic nucleotide phosphodiesterase n=1 Tax=Mycena maculata TaxID=230809 RepID=A0AAD7J8P0_9AGAR|nr:RNA ligase/cyclic nucleotide phosphodiesterase [Mycena maculata]